MGPAYLLGLERGSQGSRDILRVKWWLGLFGIEMPGDRCRDQLLLPCQNDGLLPSSSDSAQLAVVSWYREHWM